MRDVNGSRGPLRLAGAILACALLLGGCGGTATDSTGGSAEEVAPAVNRTGIKPEEARTSLRLGRDDCRALAAALTRRSGQPVNASSQPRPPHSECQLHGRGIAVSISLDASYGAHKRYFNRVVETQQFGAPDPAKMPHPVPGVGESGAYGQSAEWIPGLGTLLAVRGNRWVTISYAAAGESRPTRKAAAATVGRRAFRLSAR
ncbi:MAG TPA: hypothetical protein VFI17_12280 [Solirubrobacterales bacterium]|nr:hypothetical protein [Solirubrobacterales bacterium]